MCRCWRRLWRSHNNWLTREVDLGNQRPLSPSPVLGRYILPTLPTVGAVFKNPASREQGGVEISGHCIDWTQLRPLSNLLREFPGDLVVRTLLSLPWFQSHLPGQGTKIIQAARPKKKKNLWRFWWAGAEIHLYCCHPRQASYISFFT